MVKHIVMFKLAERTPEHMDTLVAALKDLEGKIETLLFLEVGTDFRKTERSYDIILTTHFKDAQGLNIYSAHEHHLPVVELARSLCSSSVVVDYEL